jgi:hypothetical protein
MSGKFRRRRRRRPSTPDADIENTLAARYRTRRDSAARRDGQATNELPSGVATTDRVTDCTVTATPRPMSIHMHSPRSVVGCQDTKIQSLTMQTTTAGDTYRRCDSRPAVSASRMTRARIRCEHAVQVASTDGGGSLFPCYPSPVERTVAALQTQSSLSKLAETSQLTVK